MVLKETAPELTPAFQGMSDPESKAGASLVPNRSQSVLPAIHVSSQGVSVPTRLEL
jgi:hypothetical protein